MAYISRKFERNLRRYAWHAQHSQIYPELNRLAADGLATVVEQGPRGRRTYAITDVGRIELRRWVLDPNDEPVVRNEHTLKLINEAAQTGQPPVALFAAELGARYFQTLHE